MNRDELALAIARGRPTIAARSWCSQCQWCHGWIVGHVERAYFTLIGAVCIGCFGPAVEHADRVLQLRRATTEREDLRLQ